jgi:uncharacterized protein
LNGAKVSIRQTTRYPWEGAVRIAVDPAQPTAFGVMLRIPAWCDGETVRVNGQRISTDDRVRGYVRISRTWNSNDVIELDLPLPVRQVYANPMVQADVGRTAIMRGPLVYCVESADNAHVPQLHLPQSAQLTADFVRDTLNGVVVLKARGSASGVPEEDLYATNPQAYPSTVAAITAIPYYANANRGPVDMAVWLPLTT